MKPKSIQGYSIALAFINMYEADGNTMDEIHYQIKHELSKLVFVWRQKGHKILKQIETAWFDFERMVGQNYTVSALPFALQLIVKNPNKDKHKKLTDLAIQANKMFLFKNEEEIKNSKKLINGWYGLNATKKA